MTASQACRSYTAFSWAIGFYRIVILSSAFPPAGSFSLPALNPLTSSTKATMFTYISSRSEAGADGGMVFAWS